MHPTKLEQDLRVFWRLMNPKDCVWENLCQIIMKTILQEKETIHYSITIWFTNLFLSLKLWKLLLHKKRWTRNGKNWRKFRRGTWRKSEVERRWSIKHGHRAQKFILHQWWTYVFWKMLSWRQRTKITKVELYTEVTLSKTISGSYAVFTETRIFSISNDSSRSHGYHLPISRLRWTSSGCSICFYSSANGRWFQIIEDSQVGMSSHLDSSTTTQMATIMVLYGRPSCSSWAESVWSSFGSTIWERQFEKILFEALLWEFPVGSACSYTVKRDFSYLCMWMTIKLAGKKANIDPMWKVPRKELDFGVNQHLSSIMYTWAVLKDWKKAKILWTITEPCLNHVFQRWEQRSFHTLKNFVFLHGLMTGIHTYTDLRASLHRARRGGGIRCVSRTVDDRVQGRPSDERTTCMRELVGECHPLAVIACSRRRPTCHVREEAGTLDGKASFLSWSDYTNTTTSW